MYLWYSLNLSPLLTTKIENCWLKKEIRWDFRVFSMDKIKQSQKESTTDLISGEGWRGRAPFKKSETTPKNNTFQKVLGKTISRINQHFGGNCPRDTIHCFIRAVFIVERVLEGWVIGHNTVRDRQRHSAPLMDCWCWTNLLIATVKILPAPGGFH